METITWKIGGEAGFGIMSAGTMLAKTFCRSGYYVFATNEYPSLIRGGHNLITLRISTKKIESMNQDLHILVALNTETVHLHTQELTQQSYVVYDPKDHAWSNSDFSVPVVLVPVPLGQLVTQAKGEQVMRNTVALGATVALLGADFARLGEVISDQFRKKGEGVVNFNLEIARLGYDYIRKEFSSLVSVHLSPPSQNGTHYVMNGSEAVGLGAVRSGLKFAAIYPMTPINSLITFLADHAKKLGLVFKQPEDEIAGINMAIGASMAGVRSMVATSGGGFALMVEGLSLAGMVEVPIVVDLGMRVGPATGMPTWTEQGELRFAIHAGHGEFARIVLAPANATQAYTLTWQAFELADRFQVPVILLTDKYLNESLWTVAATSFTSDMPIDRGLIASEEAVTLDGTYKRYRLDADGGVSPRSFPGMKGGQYIANSYEHDESGYVTEDASLRRNMAEKRLRKFQAIARAIPAPIVYGEPEAQVSFVTWGSSTGPLTSALQSVDYTLKGEKVNIVQFPWICPFPLLETQKLLQGKKRIIDVEQNGTAQLASLVREYTGIDIAEKLLKFDGRPFMPEEILDKVQSVK